MKKIEKEDKNMEMNKTHVIPEDFSRETASSGTHRLAYSFWKQDCCLMMMVSYRKSSCQLSTHVGSTDAVIVEAPSSWSEAVFLSCWRRSFRFRASSSSLPTVDDDSSVVVSIIWSSCCMSGTTVIAKSVVVVNQLKTWRHKNKRLKNGMKTVTWGVS